MDKGRKTGTKDMQIIRQVEVKRPNKLTSIDSQVKQEDR